MAVYILNALMLLITLIILYIDIYNILILILYNKIFLYIRIDIYMYSSTSSIKCIKIYV